MDQKQAPTRENFFRDGTQEVQPDGIPKEKHDSCSICMGKFGEPGPDGKIEAPLIQLRECGHIVGRDCLLIWLSTASKKQCPVCRATLYATERTDMTYATLSEEDSRAMRAMRVKFTSVPAGNLLALVVRLFEERHWPESLQMPQEAYQGMRLGVAAMGRWLGRHNHKTYLFAELERVLMLVAAICLTAGHVSSESEIWARTSHVESADASSVREAWARIPRQHIGLLTERYTLIFVQTALVHFNLPACRPDKLLSFA